MRTFLQGAPLSKEMPRRSSTYTLNVSVLVVFVGDVGETVGISKSTKHSTTIKESHEAQSRGKNQR